MRIRIASLLAAVLLGVSGCSDSTSSNSGTGVLTVRLTDAPFPFDLVESVDVFVVRVDAKAGTASDAETEDEDAMSDWTTVAEPNALINLLDLQSGVTTNLGSETLPTGTYRAFRLVLDVSQSSVTLKDGTQPSIIWPSAGQSGIKINLDENVELTEDGTVLILDFDIGRSFVMRGNSISQNGLLFKPVIRAVATDVTASVSGTVRQDTPTGALMAGVTIEVLVDGTPIGDATPENVVASTVTDANGAFTIDFLLPGDYEIRATPLAATTYLPALLTGGLTITAGTDVTGKLIVVTKP